MGCYMLDNTPRKSLSLLPEQLKSDLLGLKRGLEEAQRSSPLIDTNMSSHEGLSSHSLQYFEQCWKSMMYGKF